MFDFLKYRDGKAVTVRYIPSGKEETFIIGRDIDRDEVIERIDKKKRVIHAIIMYDERGEAVTKLISPEDVEFWTPS
ncbi:hypothetical protein DCC85_14355 [Paenibacillus sp. CAA11]|nr:hypothetical protein DCC85_14355 [Paenibacillus sp. CAA11]